MKMDVISCCRPQDLRHFHPDDFEAFDPCTKGRFLITRWSDNRSADDAELSFYSGGEAADRAAVTALLTEIYQCCMHWIVSAKLDVSISQHISYSFTIFIITSVRAASNKYLSNY